MNTYFEKSLKNEKFSVGPTCASPGPILFMVAATAVNEVVPPYPSNEIRNTEMVNKIMNVIK